MIEYKVISIEGRSLDDYTASINKWAAQGWKALGTMGKNNMLLLICRNVAVEEAKVDE